MGALLAVLLACAAIVSTAHRADAQSRGGTAADAEPGRGPAEASHRRPAVRMARATWDTGWFQAEIYRRLIHRLGYEVDGPHTMPNGEFYEAVGAGEVDLWVNGWFPLHDDLLADAPGARRVGNQLANGALNGYFASADAAAAADIDSLDDLRDPSLAALFDHDGDGRAELLGCDLGWACGDVIDEHLRRLSLEGTVEQVRGDYTALMAAAEEQQRAGLPVLFYAWTPNWTVGALVPGERVIWLEVPPVGGAADAAAGLIGGLRGCAHDPCATGWAANDIAAVANQGFLKRNPAIATLLELVEIPLGDILEQNSLMHRGVSHPVDIAEQAELWIERNQVRVAQWLTAADADAVPFDPGEATEQPVGQLRAVVRVLSPFVTYDNGVFDGFEVQIAELVADELGADIEFYAVSTIAKQIDDVRRGNADFALGGLEVTSENEAVADMSHSVLDSGLGIMLPADARSGVFSRIGVFLRAIGRSDLPWLLAVFAISVLLAAHVVWLLERRRNKDFRVPYARGVWDSFYWSVVTMSTVGYGDKVARRTAGKVFALLWITFGTLLFASFTASIASALAVDELRSDVVHLDDLRGQRVLTLPHTVAYTHVTSRGLSPVTVGTVEQAAHLLDEGEADAFVYDALVLRHYEAHQGQGRVTTSSATFAEVHEAFLFDTERAGLRNRVNGVLLDLMESGAYGRVYDRWFGDLD